RARRLEVGVEGVGVGSGRAVGLRQGEEGGADVDLLARGGDPGGRVEDGPGEGEVHVWLAGDMNRIIRVGRIDRDGEPVTTVFGDGIGYRAERRGGGGGRVPAVGLGGGMGGGYAGGGGGGSARTPPRR